MKHVVREALTALGRKNGERQCGGLVVKLAGRLPADHYMYRGWTERVYALGGRRRDIITPFVTIFSSSFAMVANRALASASKLHLEHWVAREALIDELPDVDVLFLDTTTTCFEIEGEDEDHEGQEALRKWGYGKDHHIGEKMRLGPQGKPHEAFGRKGKIFSG